MSNTAILLSAWDTAEDNSLSRLAIAIVVVGVWSCARGCKVCTFVQNPAYFKLEW